MDVNNFMVRHSTAWLEKTTFFPHFGVSKKIAVERRPAGQEKCTLFAGN